MEKYNGYEEITLDHKEMAFYYEGRKNFDLLDNQYLILKDESENILDILVNNGGDIRPLKYKTLKSQWQDPIKPRNPQQKMAMDMIQNENIPVKLLTGVFGSGKDLIMLGHAVDLVHQGYYDKIVFVRNNIEVRDTAPLGALPGTMQDKLWYFSGPLVDHVGGVDGYQRLVNEGKLEILHLGFLRGRDLRRCIIYSTEAENLTKEHIQLLLGRVGEGSQLWMNGDCRQRDRSVFERSEGIEQLVGSLKGNPLFGYVHMPITERSEVARLADLLD